MKEKHVLIRLVFVVLSLLLLTLNSLRSQEFYGADLSQVNLRIEGMT